MPGNRNLHGKTAGRVCRLDGKSGRRNLVCQSAQFVATRKSLLKLFVLEVAELLSWEVGSQTRHQPKPLELFPEGPRCQEARGLTAYLNSQNGITSTIWFPSWPDSCFAFSLIPADDHFSISSFYLFQCRSAFDVDCCFFFYSYWIYTAMVATAHCFESIDWWPRVRELIPLGMLSGKYKGYVASGILLSQLHY